MTSHLRFVTCTLLLSMSGIVDLHAQQDQTNSYPNTAPRQDPSAPYAQPQYPNSQYSGNAPQQPPPGMQVAPSNSDPSLSWIPQEMSALQAQASWHTDFTFDRSMLALAGNLYGLDEPTRHSLARLNGIAIHSYRFPNNGGYDPSILAGVRAQYDALGWKHMVTANSKAGSAGYAAGRTDLWLHTNGPNLAGAAVLLAGPSNVNLIVISGDLSTLDLLHLRGHFGIPRFEDNQIAH